MIIWLVIGIILFISYSIKTFIWNKTREKLENESEKQDFLKVKFSGLIDSEISKGIEFDEIDSLLLISEMAKNKQKKGTIIDVLIDQPKYSSGEWSVFLTVKSGTWPISDKEEHYIVFSISDLELNQLTEFHDYLDSKLKRTQA